MNDTIGHSFRVTYAEHAMDCIPLPHPSGASPWHRMEPGKSLLRQALALVAAHEAIRASGELRGPSTQLDLGLGGREKV